MFQIIIDDVINVNGVIAISGKCKNKNEFNAKLFDEQGNEYFVAFPFIMHITKPSSDEITLEVKNAVNPSILKGLTLCSRWKTK